MGNDDRRFRLLIALIVIPSVVLLTSYTLVACGGTSTSTSGKSNVIVAPNAGGGVTLAQQPGATQPPLAPGNTGNIASLATTAPKAAATQPTAMPAMAMGTAAPAAPATARVPYDAALPALVPLVAGTTNVRDLKITMHERTVEIAPGVPFAEWTFGDSAPGPVVHVKQGDIVKFSLTNKGSMPHSIDFHAAQVPPNKDYIDVKPDETFTFDWTADYPGVFMYHCGSPLVIAHMASGMYGAVVVDPATPLPAAREYVIVQSEFYVSKDGKVDVDKVLKGQPDYTTFNGYANQYKDAPLPAKVGERVRLYVVNAGPSEFSAFHVIGTIFENAYADGNPANAQHGLQTVTIPPGGAYMVEFTIPNEGTYAFVTHSFADVNRGAVGVIKVTK